MGPIADHINIGLLYHKQPKSRFQKIFHEDPPAPLSYNKLLQTLKIFLKNQKYYLINYSKIKNYSTE